MTKRAREHAGLVLALKVYKRCYRANGPGVSGPRWRAYRTEREKEMRASYHKPGQSVDNFAIEVEIYEKQKKALEQGKSWHWVIENVPISRSSYLYHVRRNSALKVMHKKIPSLNRPGVEITIKDLKLGKVMHYDSIQAAERALGFKTRTLHNYLKRRQQKPYLRRYEVERG